MVYLHFPTNLTEEELMLQNKYQKLRKKKTAALKQKVARPEPEVLPAKVSKGPKLEARDAREVAKKLLKSGAISPIVKTPKRPDNEGFKRPSRFRTERKPTDEKLASYQPFPVAALEEQPPEVKPSSAAKVKSLYKNFVSEKTLNKGANSIDTDAKSDKPRQASTIFVSGSKVTEELLRKKFSEYGNIIHLVVDYEKGRGFVTYDNSESSDRAITEADGSIESGISLRVSMARKQFINIPNADGPNISSWCNIAKSTGHTQKSNFKEKRDINSYSDDWL